MRRIILLTGVSCSGKTTLAKALEQTGEYIVPPSYTTRKPRSQHTINELSINKNDWDNANTVGDENKLVEKREEFFSEELGEYVFITKEQFYKKLQNGDFIDNTNYLGNNYGISKHLPLNKNIVLILDPVGRSQVLEYFVRKGIDVETYYLEITKELQLERLNKREATEKDILSRVRDFQWFSRTDKCVRLNGATDTDKLVDIIQNKLGV